MKSRLMVVLMSVGVAISSQAMSGGASVGAKEYQFKCAVCHGKAGKGDGPYVDLLKVSPTDLTVLQKNNAGQFPFEHVFQVIDGRANIKAHGGRDMPIWGNEYTDEAIEYYADLYDSRNAELFVHGRVLALITYLQSLQEK